MTTAIIVQARMNSSRLPGKVMMPILGLPLLEFLIERLKRVSQADLICVACTTNLADEPIVDLSQTLGVAIYRGSEEDALARYFEAAQTLRAINVVRVTADSPLLDPAELDRLILFYRSNSPKFAYVDNASNHTYPLGMQAEVFSMSALSTAHYEASTAYDREHLTSFIIRNPGRFKAGNVAFGQDKSYYQLAVDTAEDFELITKIITGLYPVNPEFSIHDVLDLLARNPEWGKVNSHI